MKMLCIMFCVISGISLAHAQVDLHAHLDMKPGMGPGIIGSFDSPIRAKGPESRIPTKASLASLTSEHAPALVVASLYGHPWLSHLFSFQPEENVREALEAEYQDLLKFVSEHSDKWIIAKNAKEARLAIKTGKHVLVLSIEGAYGAFQNQADFQKWVEDRGVAIVTPFHLTEDHFGGAAFMLLKVAYFNAPIRFLESVFLTGGTCLKTFCKSPMGIKPDGTTLIQNLMNRKVWIDLSHANDMEVAELLPEFQKRKLPLLITHTALREIYPAERAAAPAAIDYIIKNGGSLGLIPSDDFLVETGHGGCFSGLEELKGELQKTGNSIGFEKVTLGSDANAPLRGLSAVCKQSVGSPKSELEQKGFYDYQDFSSLTAWLSPNREWNDLVLEEFLKNWERVRPD